MAPVLREIIVGMDMDMVLKDANNFKIMASENEKTLRPTLPYIYQ